MAIEVTSFTSDTAAANAVEVCNWLIANAADYFDEITVSGTTITCNVGENDFLTISTSNESDSKIKLPSGNNISSSYLSKICQKGYKTSKGIAIFAKDDVSFFISRTDNGTTCAVVTGQVQYRRVRISGADAAASTTVSVYPKGSTQADNAAALLSQAFCSADKAAIVPYVFDNGTYAPDIFIVPFSPVLGTRTILDLDGIKYVYDGFVALRE